MRNETLEKSPLDTSTKALMKSIIKGYISPRQRLLNGSLDRLCQERDTVMYLITHCEMNEPQSKHAKYVAECYQRIIKLHQVFCDEHKTGYHLSGLKVWGELCKVVYSVDPQDTNLVHLMVLNYAKTNQPIEVADRKAYDTIMRWCEQIGLDKEQLAYVDNNLKYKKVRIPMDKQNPKEETNMKETTGRISDFELYANARAAVEQFGESHYLTGTDALEEIRAVYIDILALPVLTGIVGNYAKLFVIYEQALLALGDIYSGRMTVTEYVNKVTTKVREVKEGQCEGPNLLDQVHGLINGTRLRLIPVVDQWLTNGITDSELEDLMSPNADLGVRMLVVERANLLGKQLVRREYDHPRGTVIGTIDNRILERPFFGWFDPNSDHRLSVITNQDHNYEVKGIRQQPESAVRVECCGCRNPLKTTEFSIELNEQDENPLKSIQHLRVDYTKRQILGGAYIGRDMFIKIGLLTIQDLSNLPLPVLPHCYTVERASEVLTNFANSNNATIDKLAEILAVLYINAPVGVSVPAIKQHYVENNGTPKLLEGIERTHAEKLLANMLTNKFGKANW